jgi:transcription antitermination factor NusG
MDTFAAGWYVVYTRSRHEKKVHDELALQQRTVYLPLVQTTSVWSDRLKIIEKPLFPSYVFVWLTGKQDSFKTLQIKGTVDFVRIGGQLSVVRESEIEQIKMLIRHCSNIELVQSDIKIGEKRLITAGPLVGFECETLSYKGKDKIIVRIESLKQNIIAELKYTHLLQNDLEVRIRD